MNNASLNRLFHILGLTNKEVAIYKALHSHKVATVAEIAETAGIKRPNTYNILKNLERLGIITSFLENKRLHYKSLGTEALNTYLEKQTALLKEQQNSLSEIQIELDSLEHTKSKHKKDVIVFEGRNAALQTWYDMLRLNPGDTIYDIEVGNSGYEPQHTNTNTQFTLQDLKAFARARIKKKIYVNFISTTPPEIDNALANENLMRYSDALYIPPALWPWPIELGVYGNKFYYFTYEENPKSVIIENPVFAKSMLHLIQNFRKSLLKQKGTRHIVRE